MNVKPLFFPLLVFVSIIFIIQLWFRKSEPFYEIDDTAALNSDSNTDSTAPLATLSQNVKAAAAQATTDLDGLRVAARAEVRRLRYDLGMLKGRLENAEARQNAAAAAYGYTP